MTQPVFTFGIKEAVDITDIPERLAERLQHYFSTYKMVPGSPAQATIREVYGVGHAEQVVLAALEDYSDMFGQESAR